MSRPLRLEFPAAVYHVTARGNARQAIFADDADRERFLELLGREVQQQRWRCHAYCQMGNHYHLLLETPEASLGRGMAHLNMAYSQWFNRRHRRAGHLFQGRYKAILVEKDSHLLELCRYVVLSPVRAGLVEFTRDWRWSSYRATASGRGGSPWLTTQWILEQFGGEAGRARQAYRRFVREGKGAASPWRDLRGQIFLGGEAFMRKMAHRARRQSLAQQPAAVARPDRPTVDQICAAVAGAAQVPPETVLDRRAAREAFQVTVYLLRRACNLPLKEVAALAHVSPPRISQIQRAIEDTGGLGQACAWATELERYYKLKC